MDFKSHAPLPRGERAEGAGGGTPSRVSDDKDSIAHGIDIGERIGRRRSDQQGVELRAQPVFSGLLCGIGDNHETVVDP